MRKGFSPLACGVSLAVMCVPCVAIAQDSGQRVGLEDIIVTARKRDESLLSVPVAVSAISAQGLKNYNLDNMAKISEAIPQVKIINAASGSGGILSIRGVGSPPIDSGIAQSVAVVIDDTGLSQGNLVKLGFFDLNSVQVLKGPQALFFGKNSPAGVIAFTSKGPGDKWEFNGRAAYEFVGDEKVVEGGVGGPVTDTLGIRFAGRYRGLTGYTFNDMTSVVDPILGVTIPDPKYRRDPHEREFSGRFTAVWDITPDFIATLKLVGQSIKTNGDASLYDQVACAPGQTVPTVLGIPDPQQSCNFDRHHSQGAYPIETIVGIPHVRDGQGWSQFRALVGSLKLAYTADKMTVTSISSYTKYNFRSMGNFGGSTYAWFGGFNAEYFDSKSQEFRFASSLDGPFNFIGGAYYENTELVTEGYRFLGPFGPDPVTGNWYTQGSKPSLKGQSLSVFVQGRYNLLDALELSGGARITTDQKKLRLGNFFVHSYATFLSPQGLYSTGKFNDDNVSPEVTLTYKPQPSVMIYGAYKSGYKGGGFGMPNVISRGQTADTTRLDSEKSHGFEIGTKAQIFDNSLRAQLTAYSYKFKNLQTVSFDGTTVSYQFNNAAAATTKGVELQLDWQATPELRFASALTYNKARFKSFPTAQCYGLQAATPGSGCVKSAAFPSGVQDLSGARLPHASDWMGSLSFNYDKPVGDYHVVLYGDVNYQSKMNSSEINDPAGEVPGFAKVNAGIKFGPSEGPWEIAVFGRNLTNRLYFTTVNDKAGGLPGEVSANSSSRPREIWVETSVKF